jgi:DNA-binding response OmpR family regulator
LKVLVVEDEFVIATELRRALQGAGYEVLGPVATVAAALTLLDKSRPDAAILDYGLRKETSTPVAEALREQNVPFLVSSAYKEETFQWHQAFKGILNVGKPVQEKELLSALDLILGQ